MRDLHLQDDEIDEVSLTPHQKELLTENHQISMSYKEHNQKKLIFL